MVTAVGDRVLAVAEIEGNIVFVFGVGVYEGMEIPPPGVGRNLALDLEYELMPTAKIRLDNGEIVWGCECHFGPEQEFREVIRRQIPTAIFLPINLRAWRIENALPWVDL
ncbi:MAG: hypothetical protein C4521_02805 [Actinobacteria bacterium]|jgi:hypothetical protein|nr:MAG: hypothetical protein C4521_02805 [Actinomycetota bacterium]